MIVHKLFADGTGGVFASGSPAGVTARWTGHAWVTVADGSTSRREASAGAYDTHRKRFVLFGGHIGGRVFRADTWEFDGRARAATAGPSPMIGGAMAYDARRHVTVLFGGLDTTGHKLGDTWEWDGARWAHVH